MVARSYSVRCLIAAAHIQICLRWPTLLAIAAVRALPRQPQDDVRSILLVRLDGLGDCILTLPFIELLHQCYPDARLTVLTTPMAAPLFLTLPLVDEVAVVCPAWTLRWPKYLRGLLGALRAASHLREHRFDIAILPRWDADIYHGTLLCALSRAPVRTGYADHTTAYKLRTCRGFQRAWTAVLPPGPLQHEAQRSLEMASALGCETHDPQPHLPLTENMREAAHAWLATALSDSAGNWTLIGVGLPAAEAKKRWPAGLYREALQQIAQHHPVAFVFFADADTASVARTLQAALPQSCIAQQLPLLLAAALLAECAVFTGTDSGLGHLAAAVGCPTVTLFAQAADCNDNTGWDSNSPERFRPLSTRGAVLQPEQARPGCSHGCCHTEPHCILDITPQRVADAVTSLLPHASTKGQSLAMER